MTDSPFRGVIPPVVIPLTEKRQLDLESLERTINRMIDAGVDGLFFLGSSGEVAFLTDAQRYHVLQEAVAMVHGRVPVMAGIIDMETLRVVDQAKRASGYGVDALVATAPFYAPCGPCARCAVRALWLARRSRPRPPRPSAARPGCPRVAARCLSSENRARKGALWYNTERLLQVERTEPS